MKLENRLHCKMLQILEKRRNLKMTILHRPGGAWLKLEVARLIKYLMVNVTEDEDFPEYLVVSGHHTKEKIIKAILVGGFSCKVTQVTGYDSKVLPFKPSFT